MNQILTFLGYVNTASWVIAAVSAYKFKGLFASSQKSWTMVMIGSIFMVARQLCKNIPGYAGSLDIQLIRYVIGTIAGAILVGGFYKLYKEAKSINDF